MGELGKMGNKISIAHYPIPYDTPSEAEVFPVPCSLFPPLTTTLIQQPLLRELMVLSQKCFNGLQ